MSKRLPTVWDADPHTIAKIDILKGYLNAWFRILGKTRKGQTILYVDGFAGPGFYRNHAEGSPLAAIQAAKGALQELGKEFIARDIRCAFIEDNADRFKHLTQALACADGIDKLGIYKTNCEFVVGIESLRKDVPGPFAGDGPLFVFVDPFGGTEIPFSSLASCMHGSSAELLINLDADGIARIFSADNNGREAQLTGLFGCDDWRTGLTSVNDFKQLSVQILDLYKKRLRTLPGVRYVWSFAMRGKGDALSYHLVFATKHPLGMGKMKEAMKAIDKTGSYTFSDAHVDQQVLFRADNEEVYADAMFQAMQGKTISMEAAKDYALNETPFLTAKPLLSVLHAKHRIKVQAKPGMTLKAGTFPDDKVQSITFDKFGEVAVQAEMF